MRVDLLQQNCFFHKRVSHSFVHWLKMAESSGYILLKTGALYKYPSLQQARTYILFMDLFIYRLQSRRGKKSRRSCEENNGRQWKTIRGTIGGHWNFVDIITNMLLRLQSKNRHSVSKFVTYFFYHAFFQREDAKYYMKRPILIQTCDI